MFTYSLDEYTELRPLAIEHTKPLFELTDRSRDQLRHWLPWVDHVTEVNTPRTSLPTR